MNQIFNTGDGRKLVIFDSSNSLLMSALGRDSASRPTLLSNDYSKYLSACIHTNKLYYAYISSNNLIKVKSIDENKTKWEFNEAAENLFLATHDNLLILFYTKEESEITKTPSTDCEDLANTNIEADLTERKKMNIYSHILIGESSMSNSALLMHIYEKTLMPRVYTDYCINNHIEHQLNETLLQTKKDYLFTITSELEEKYAKKEAAAKKIREEESLAKEVQIRKLCHEESAARESELKQKFQEQLKANEAAVRAQCENQGASRENTLKRNYEKKIKELNATISSIKLQYEQLMNTASRYREESAKWHSMYHAKNRKMQSGNNN